MIIGAMGDAHGGKHLKKEVGERLGEVDLLLLAGDVAEKNDLDSFGSVIDSIRSSYSSEIIAVFGNEEYEQDHREYRDRFDVTFLDDEAADRRIGGVNLRIVGTTGSLDRPTWWQRTHIPQVWNRYRDRAHRVGRLLERKGADAVVLLSHYAPTYLTLKGEREKAFPEMGSLAMEKVILEKRPDLVLHAHAHSGARSAVLENEQRSLEDFNRGAGIPVWNVSLPLAGEVTRFSITKGDGLNVRVL